jgi:hypothetical protein
MSEAVVPTEKSRTGTPSGGKKILLQKLFSELRAPQI